MQKKEITLSRKEGGYADKATVDKFLGKFSLSPDNQKLEDVKKAANQNGAQDNNSASQTGSYENQKENKKNPDKKNEPERNQDTASDTAENNENEKNKPSNLGISKSDIISRKLDALESIKLLGLYRSLCNVSLNTNPQLMYVGAWSFLECMCDHMGKNEKTSFKSFLDGKMNAWGFERKKKNNNGISLKDIMDKGNANKHSATYASTNASQLKVDFQVLEELLGKCLDELIEEKKKVA